MDGQGIVNADIPIVVGASTVTALPNGGKVTVTKTSEGKVTEPGKWPWSPSTEYNLPEYEVTINAAPGSEIHKDIDISTNYKTEENSEVWAINLVGVDALSCYNGKGYQQGKLNPVIHSFQG